MIEGEHSMITVVWRIYGDNFNVDKFLSINPELSPSLVWRKGELRRGYKELMINSGVNIPFCERETIEDVMTVVFRWLKKWRQKILTLRKRRVYSTLDFAVYVGSLKQFAVQINFHPKYLLRLAKAGVCLTVSAYPVSDDN
ncbi:MAG: hypothetical protein JW841_08040 [Deltaproteobacteria bacterium]|nr:hypothetical protein [Deltaproteobacteria bacterium]